MHSLATRFKQRAPRLSQAFLALVGVGFVYLLAGIAFFLHFNLSTAGSIELFLVVLVALRVGFLPATVVSINAVIALNYLFTPPIFQLTVADPQNLVSLITFEAAALLASHLSSKVKLSAQAAELQRLRSVKLYELSRAILLIDNRMSVPDQLSSLIGELVDVQEAKLWVESERVIPDDPKTSDALEIGPPDRQTDSDDIASHTSRRTLRIGTTPIGAMTLHGWEVDPLLADAIASLAAIAIERSRAIQRENRAEAERNTEQLRTAVLDGLAHGFKTPLTAIRTASTGLLAIDHLTETQTELVTIIDDQASTLNQLTTRLLKTAALESREIRLQRAEVSLPLLLQKVIREQDDETRSRIHVAFEESLQPCEGDSQMIELAALQLIDNAAKYSEVDSRIDIAVTQSAGETFIIVENAGPPLRKEEREKIFQRFFRGADATRGPSGTGLGLSIVRKTAEAHGGRAWAESANGVNRFTFTLLQNRKARHG